MLLAGDIGGTKTSIGIFSENNGPRAALAETEVHSADYPILESIATEFLVKTGLRADRACFGVAGPVLDGRAKVTNLPWIVDQATIARELDLAAVDLLNDVESIACAVPELRPEDVDTLSAGKAVGRGEHLGPGPPEGIGVLLCGRLHGYRRAARC